MVLVSKIVIVASATIISSKYCRQEINIHTNTHELYEIRTHHAAEDCANRSLRLQLTGFINYAVPITSHMQSWHAAQYKSLA
jgi:hypothetical protein